MADPGSFALEKPTQYNAFLQMAVKASPDGSVKVILHERMCEDRHVPDFLLCLHCWLSSSRKPWRLACLDLSRNGLSDESLCTIIALLQRIDLRVGHLLISGNRLAAAGVDALTQFLWNCPDPLLELDISDNEVLADPAAGLGNDKFSALLRCLYNHPGYPNTVDDGRGERKVLPLTLRAAGNFLIEPARLLTEIESKVGRKQVRFCTSGDAYKVSEVKEFLSVYLPDLEKQKLAAVTPAAPARMAEEHRDQREPRQHRDRERSRSKKRRRRREQEAVPAPAPIPAPAPVEGTHRREKEKKKKSEHEERRKDAAAGQKREKSSRHRHGETGETEPKAKAAKAAKASSSPSIPRMPRDSTPLGWSQQVQDTQPNGNSALTEEEQRQLQKAMDKHLSGIDGLPSEQSTRDMLAEFAVCMLVAKKSPKEIESELSSFLGDQAKNVAAWFAGHVRSKFPRRFGPGW